MFDICFVDGVDDVIEYHVKAENTFNHFIDGMLFGNMLKNHSVHGAMSKTTKFELGLNLKK